MALCNAPPFNAPCSPVTPLLLVIAWYCTVLPCAPSCLQSESMHSAQQAIVLYCGVSVRAQGCDFEVEWIGVCNFGLSSRSSLIASFRAAAAGDANRAPWVLAPCGALQVNSMGRNYLSISASDLVTVKNKHTKKLPQLICCVSCLNNIPCLSHISKYLYTNTKHFLNTSNVEFTFLAILLKQKC